MIMTKFERLAPNPIPTPSPLPEYLAQGQRLRWYEEMKQSLQVPWMGIVTMAFSHYSNFFGELWDGLRPLCETEQFAVAVKDLQNYAEAEVLKLKPKSILSELKDLGYAPKEIQNIIDVNTVFSHGNQPYVMIATIARYLLEGGEIAGKGVGKPFIGKHCPNVDVPLVLLENHHADKPTQAIYQDIKDVLKLPIVNTDYRAFARWPSCFELQWNDLRDKPLTPAHEAICTGIHDKLAKLVSKEFPNPGGLDSTKLRAAAEKDGSLEEVLAVVRLFQWLLPSLVVNVAYFRHQLEAVD